MIRAIDVNKKYEQKYMNHIRAQNVTNSQNVTLTGKKEESF